MRNRSLAPRLHGVFTSGLALGLLLCPSLFSEEKSDLPSLKKALVRAIDFRNSVQIKSILEKISRINTVPAADVIVQVSFQLRDLDFYDSEVSFLVSMDDPKVREFIYKGARSSREWMVRYLLLEVAARIPDPKAEKVLSEAAMNEKSTRVLDFAIDLLSRARKPSAVDALIDLLEKAEKKADNSGLRERVIEALQGTTGKDMEAASDWRKWWSPIRDSFKFPDPQGKDLSEKDKKKGITTVIQRIKKRKEEHFLTGISKGDIIVVEGIFDEVQVVLKELKIPFEEIGQSEISDRKFAPESILIFNCDEMEKNRLSASSKKAIREFVAGGGYLFTSDWELQNVISPCFPGTINMSRFTEEGEVKISPSAENDDHPYLRDVFPENPYKLANFRWKIDSGSSTLSFDPKSVYALVESKEMKEKYGNSAVAVTFRHGRGSVLHVLSHFKSQRDPKGDGYALQQLLANFIIEKQKWRKGGEPAKKRGK